MKSKYFKEIDVLKGIGIFLVVLGHTPISASLCHLIFSFHMPLFFFLSGFVFKKAPMFDFFIKKVKRIMIPYYIFSLVSFLMYFSLNHKNSIFTIKDFIIGTVLGISNDFYLSWNIALWFLPSLFFLNIMLNFLFIFKNKKIKYLILTDLSAIGVYITYLKLPILPFHIYSSLLMIPFFILGFMTKKYYTSFTLKSKILESFITMGLLLAGLYMGYLNTQSPDVRFHIIGNPLTFYLGASLSIIGFLLLSKNIKYNNALEWLGINSLAILLIHLKVRFLSVKFISSFLNSNSDINGILISILSILMMIIPIFIINKYVPFVVGVKK